MTLNSDVLRADLDIIEQVEKATLRMVVQAIHDFREDAIEIFAGESDLVADIGEDITREALDRLGMPTIPVRLFGKIDYKRATYLFQPEYAVRQALFVDSKAEKISGARTATIQTSQTSMQIRQIRQRQPVNVIGEMDTIATVRDVEYLATTIFVKYNYSEDSVHDPRNRLQSMSVLCLPNGLLQHRYNPSANDGIWLAGRNAPTRGEAFRVRISLTALKTRQIGGCKPLPPTRLKHSLGMIEPIAGVLMLTHEQTKTAYELLEQADAAFEAGDGILGSQKLWGAFAETMEVIARTRGLPCDDDDDIRQVLHHLATPEQNYLTLVAWFSTARMFREASARGGPKDYEVEIFRPEMRRIIDEFVALS